MLTGRLSARCGHTNYEDLVSNISLMKSTPFPHSAGQAACDDCVTPNSLEFRFSYAYQPIVDVRNRTIYAHEALVRGEHDEPAHTILSKVNEVNRYRFDQACRIKAIKVASALGLNERLSINFLPNAIYRPELCIQTTLQAARTHDFPIERIIFEATEGEAVKDGKWLATILTEYKRTGFLTAIDDFGAGYAGLNLLADFQPDIIKLDMALVRGADSSRSRQAIARGVLRICHELDVLVIVEGVETTAERDFFFDEGVSLMQGYLFSRPTFESIGKIADESWPSLSSPLLATPSAFGRFCTCFSSTTLPGIG
jgi:EAL domain-containing protein (putative c-di-GMP-specific phosphodiesterase class I)